MKKANKNNTTTLFDNYDNYDTIKQIQLELSEYEEYEFTTENQLFSIACDMVASDEREEWREMLKELDKQFSTKWIVSANVGTWQGKREGYRIFEDTEDMMRTLCEHCDYIKVWKENNNLFVKASHHDGTNNYQCKVLTGKGCVTYNDWNWGCGDGKLAEKSEFEICEFLFGSNFYSKNLKF